MDVIYSQDRKKGSNLPLDNAFLDRIKRDYPNFRFVEGRKFAFRPPRTIVMGPDETNWRMLLLHEVGHAICGHKTFNMDVKRIKMEVEAWEKAREIAKDYEASLNEDFIEEELDTYRDWLHQKSRCPICGLTRFQTPDSQYHCPSCETFKNNKK